MIYLYISPPRAFPRWKDAYWNYEIQIPKNLNLPSGWYDQIYCFPGRVGVADNRIIVFSSEPSSQDSQDCYFVLWEEGYRATLDNNLTTAPVLFLANPGSGAAEAVLLVAKFEQEGQRVVIKLKARGKADPYYHAYKRSKGKVVVEGSKTTYLQGTWLV